MSRQLSPERRKIVVIAGGVAAGSGISAKLMQDHRWLGYAWLGVMACALVYVITQMVKLKRSDCARREAEKPAR